MRRDVHPRTTFVDEPGSDFGFGVAHVLLPEEELAVQVRDVDTVQVDHVYVRNARHGQVFEEFTAQSSRADD
eukprot:CAMPEP_0172510016 /NCGR_PEP_ID=MMETSP1066-20121228/225444_1 /TAXON_ID=671091 /ORGANISM="Coscinodiscus wailesii, Strain CCMP2513" /LENGTH=71 /DNA_ID=CAMNT_0013288803 /DNA_START=1118 /DNA_END=1333 /DNA_ORIENTATION=-